MKRNVIRLLLVALLLEGIGYSRSMAQAPPGAPVTPDLAALARSGELHAGPRSVAELTDGARHGVRVTAAEREVPIYIPGVELATGTIELDVRGKDITGGSFLGVAFGGTDDTTLEGVYVRPFNFRSTDPARRQHAVQYVSLPTHTWQQLRSDHPEVFENPVDPAPDPNGWVHLRVVVEPARAQVFVGEGADPDLVVERLGERTGRRVGLWVGFNTEADFANLRIVPDR